MQNLATKHQFHCSHVHQLPVWGTQQCRRRWGLCQYVGGWRLEWCHVWQCWPPVSVPLWNRWDIWTFQSGEGGAFPFHFAWTHQQSCGAQIWAVLRGKLEVKGEQISGSENSSAGGLYPKLTECWLFFSFVHILHFRSVERGVSQDQKSSSLRHISMETCMSTVHDVTMIQ